MTPCSGHTSCAVHGEHPLSAHKTRGVMLPAERVGSRVLKLLYYLRRSILLIQNTLHILPSVQWAATHYLFRKELVLSSLCSVPHRWLFVPFDHAVPGAIVPRARRGHHGPVVRSAHRFRAGDPSRATSPAAWTCKPAPRSGVRPCPAEERVRRPRLCCASSCWRELRGHAAARPARGASNCR
jgi:hypothetical protein